MFQKKLKPWGEILGRGWGENKVAKKIETKAYQG
jgi:hypothetical protein